MVKYLLFFFIFLSSGFTLASDHNGFLFQQECPDIDAQTFQQKEISVSSDSVHLKIFWKKNKDAPYIVYVPKGFLVALIQIRQKIKEYGLDKYLPKNIEIYSFGEKFPGTLADYSALICKGIQTPSTMKILVNDNFLSNLIIFKRQLSHEFIHYLAILLNKHYPAWFEEGLALNFENRVTSVEQLGLGIYHMRASPWMPLEPNFSLKTTSEKKSFYGHSLLFVRYLSKNQNNDFFKNVFESPNSEPVFIFQGFKNKFYDFEIKKYINQMDYLGKTIQDIEEYLIIDGVQTDMQPHTLMPGTLGASLTQNPQGTHAEYFNTGDLILVSQKPIKKIGAKILSFSY